MMLLAGHLQFAAYGLMAVVLVGIASPLLVFPRVEARSEGTEHREENEQEPGVGQEGLSPLPPPPRRATWKGGAAVLLALVLGAALAAPQLLPVLSYAKESHRRNVPTEEGYRAYVGSSLRPFELATLGHPMALGDPREPIDAGGQTISTYWPAVARPGANFAESAVSLGPVVFALLFAVPWRRRAAWPLAGLGLFALLLALGTPLDRLLYFLVPGWSSTGSPARVEVLFVLAACALAGLAVDRATERKAQIAMGVGLLAALLLAFVLPNLAEAQGAAIQIRGIVTMGALGSILGALSLGALGLLGAKRSRWSIPVAVAVVACYTHALTLVPFGKPLDPPKGDPNVRIAVVNDAWDLLTAQPAVLPPNLAALGGLHELSGYDSLTSRDAVEMLRTVNGGADPAPPANGNMMFVKPSVDPKALAECGVTEVWSRKPLPQLGTPEEREGYVVYRISGPGRVTGGTVADRYDGQDLTLAPGVDRMVVRDRDAKGWGRADGLEDAEVSSEGSRRWREVAASGNPDRRVRFDYRPPGLIDGLILGAVAWLVLVGLSVVGWRASARTGRV